MRTYEELLKEWSPKNPGKLSDYSTGSHYQALWICAKGHEWKTPIKLRYSGSSCPYCTGRYAIKGENDFLTLFPDIAAQWHPEKNTGITPDMFKPHSHKKVWWLCPKCGYEWTAPIDSRTSGRGCAVCGGKRHGIIARNLAVDRPELLKEWDYDTNIVRPEDITINSPLLVAWKCAKGHHWTALVRSRTMPGRPNLCPYCAGKRAIPGETDLATTDPEIAAEWAEKNVLTPSDVLRTSHKKVWWRCEKGHIYPATVANRTNGKGCPVCAGKVPDRNEEQNG